MIVKYPRTFVCSSNLQPRHAEGAAEVEGEPGVGGGARPGRGGVVSVHRGDTCGVTYHSPHPLRTM